VLLDVVLHVTGASRQKEIPVIGVRLLQHQDRTEPHDLMEGEWPRVFEDSNVGVVETPVQIPGFDVAAENSFSRLP